MGNVTAANPVSATAEERQHAAEQIVDEVWLDLRPTFVALVAGFLGTPLSPQSFLQFERDLVNGVREFGRRLLERVLNALEPEAAAQLPRDLWHEGGGYRRRNNKTRNAYVATLLGTVSVWRFAYRSWDEGGGSFFPLELFLGLTQGVTPGLADVLGRQMAEAGASQQRVLHWLAEEHGVRMGVKRLRAVIDALSEGLAEFRQENQVQALLEALRTAQQGAGPRKPVLAVGRDGITLRGCEKIELGPQK
jgi:hypothetical protein